MNSRKFNLLVALSFLIVLGLSACGDLFGIGENFLKAEFDGKVIEWNGPAVTAIEVDTFNGVIVQGIRTNSSTDIEQISIALAGFDGEGTYTNSGTGSSQLVSFTKASSDTTYRAISNDGEIIVNAYNNSVIEATFSFTLRVMGGTQTIDVKNGSFQAKIIER